MTATAQSCNAAGLSAFGEPRLESRLKFADPRY